MSIDGDDVWLDFDEDRGRSTDDERTKVEAQHKRAEIQKSPIKSRDDAHGRRGWQKEDRGAIELTLSIDINPIQSATFLPTPFNLINSVLHSTPSCSLLSDSRKFLTPLLVRVPPSEPSPKSGLPCSVTSRFKLLTMNPARYPNPSSLNVLSRFGSDIKAEGGGNCLYSTVPLSNSSSTGCSSGPISTGAALRSEDGKESVRNTGEYWAWSLCNREVIRGTLFAEEVINL